MGLLLLAVGLLVASGAAALLTARSPQWCTRCGAGGAVLACVAGLIPSVRVLLGATPASLHVAWNIPYGSFSVEVDPISAFFLLPIFGLSGLAATYGAEYLYSYRRSRSLGAPWFFFNLLAASMVMVVLARNGMLFLMAWEGMTLASFFLVTFFDEEESVRQAGWTYLVAMHLGTACVLALFAMLGHESGSLDFDRFAVHPDQAGLLFLLAVIGFGTKAGFLPFHVWLPEAHPAAPSHVSAVMSGVMIKTGIYGLVRTLTFLGAPAAWWGWLLCGIGVTSGLAGVLFALAQHDLKRLLAYHSVENIGIIALGLGVGVLGVHVGLPALAVLGFAGGLLHVLNHALFKGLLFLGAGAVAHATGTREIDHLGGLLRKMPWTGGAFLVGAAAISGLPPLNGFMSELLIYLGAFHGVVSPSGTTIVSVLCVIGALALIGGLASACFTKAFGVVFLGHARSRHAEHAHEPGLAMRVPMLILAVACGLMGICAPFFLPVMSPMLVDLIALPAAEVQAYIASAAGWLRLSALGCGAVLVLVLLLAGVRRLLLSGRAVGEAGTWDCGYAQSSARMQYTGSSFAQPLTELFGPLLRTQQHVVKPGGLFPRSARLATETPDVCSERVYVPLFTAIERGLSRLRWLQHGRVHLYVLYLALTALLLMAWKLG